MTRWPLLLAAAPLAAAAWKDGKTRTIPNACAAAVLLCAAVNVALGQLAPWEAASGLAVIGAVLLLFACADSGSIGGGDLKLCAALGALTGTVNGLLLIAAALATMAVCAALRRKKALPFAPFLFPLYLLFLILEMNAQ
jgi:Flp pilus assembly protein protease CpaA